MTNWVDSGVGRGVLRCVQVTGLFLLLAAAYRAVPAIRYVSDFARMRQWVGVPTTVLEADYRKHESDMRPRVRATYRYVFDDVEYQGARVDIAESGEFFGDFQKQMAEELKQHLKDRTHAIAYVNPSQPEESVLYPRFIYTAFGIRLFMFFLPAFFGGLLFWPMTAALRRQKQQAIEQQAHPDEPWLWRRDWASKLIRTSSYRYAWFVVFIAAIYLLVALPLSLLVLRERGRDFFSVPGVILMLVGLAFFNAASLQLRNRKIFGGAEFRMSSAPGLIGGSLAGVVVLRGKVPEDTKFRVVLECAQYQHTFTETRTESGKNLKTLEGNERVIWRDATIIENTLAAGDLHSTAIPVCFHIPFDCDWVRNRLGIHSAK